MTFADALKGMEKGEIWEASSDYEERTKYRIRDGCLEFEFDGVWGDCDAPTFEAMNWFWRKYERRWELTESDVFRLARVWLASPHPDWKAHAVKWLEENAKEIK